MAAGGHRLCSAHGEYWPEWAARQADRLHAAPPGGESLAQVTARRDEYVAAANVLATALLAWMVLRMQATVADRPALRAFIGVGICGGFSTFSTFSYENFLLLRDGLYGHAVANIAISVGAGILLFTLFARSA